MLSHIYFKTKSSEIPLEVSRLAFELHSQRTNKISIQALGTFAFASPEISEICHIEVNELIFTSLSARNHCTAVHCLRDFEKSGFPLDVRISFDKAHQLWINEITHDDLASGRFLGLLSEKYNILQAGTDSISKSNAQSVFDVLLSIGNALPYIVNINIQDLIDLVEAQHKKTSGNSSSSMFFSQLRDYLTVHTSDAKTLYTLVRENITQANTELYDAALTSLAMADQIREATFFALDDIASSCDDIVIAALWVLGRISRQWEKETDLKARVQETIKAMGYHSELKVKLQAWNALSNAADSQPELITELLTHAQTKNQEALQILGNFVSMNLEVVESHPNNIEIFQILTELDANRVHNFDYALSKLVGNCANHQLIYSCITMWMVKHYNDKTLDGKLIHCFDQSIMELLKTSLLSELMTRWLISDEWALGSTFGDLISHLWVHEFRCPVLSKRLIDTFNAQDLKHLARRLLGWTFHEEPLLSMAFSLLETDDARSRTFGLVYHLLVKHIGRDYPRATLENIQEKVINASPEVANLLSSIKDELHAYTEAINQLPLRQELKPPMQLCRAIAVKRARENRDSMEKINEQSIFHQFCNRIPLKAGIGFFSLHDEMIGEISRLASRSYSASLPVQSVLDPLNDAISRLEFRLAKRGDK